VEDPEPEEAALPLDEFPPAAAPVVEALEPLPAPPVTPGRAVVVGVTVA
jgi:hypothetical protein